VFGSGIAVMVVGRSNRLRHDHRVRRGSRGHGPRLLWTKTVPGRGTAGRQLKPEEVEKVRGELARYQEFAALSEQIAEVSEAICEARPVPAARAGQAPPPEGQRGGSARRSRRRPPPR